VQLWSESFSADGLTSSRRDPTLRNLNRRALRTLYYWQLPPCNHKIFCQLRQGGTSRQLEEGRILHNIIAEQAHRNLLRVDISNLLPDLLVIDDRLHRMLRYSLGQRVGTGSHNKRRRPGRIGRP
jgi:hypothetical protein